VLSVGLGVTFCVYLLDELDSYMYQTVGHMGIEKLAEAMELPLFRKTTSGITTQKGKDYEPTEDDEVEDLYDLLKQVKVKSPALVAQLTHFQARDSF
jgi:diphthine-ammonia ligase